MPGPAIQNPTLFRGTIGVTQGAIRPVVVGNRPFTQLTRGKRPVRLHFARGSASATPSYGAIGVYGVELPYPTADFGTDSLGRRLPGINPNTGSTGQPTTTGGSYVQRVRVTGGVATGISYVSVVEGGADYTAAPTVVFTPALGGVAATAIVRDRRVVGVTVTNVGSGYTAAPVITFTGGGSPTRACQATTGIGAQLTVNTNIPFIAHTPLTAGGQYWFAVYQDKVIMCSTSAVAAFNNADDGVLDPDHHLMGQAANAGFTVASGTNPDGTLAVGILTLSNGVPNNAVVTVYSGLVRELSAQLTHLNDNTQIKSLDLMYLVGGAAGDNSISNIDLLPVFAG